jgi:hypothetical protein
LNSGIPDAFLAAAAVDSALKSKVAGEAMAAVDHFSAIATDRGASRTASHQTPRYDIWPHFDLRIKTRAAAFAECFPERPLVGSRHRMDHRWVRPMPMVCVLVPVKIESPPSIASVAT